MTKVDGKKIMMLMVIEEGNKSRNVVRRQRTKKAIEEKIRKKLKA
jgi:hypothetical protein